MDLRPVDLAEALQTFVDAWSPRTVATVNDYDVRVAKFSGDFTRHRHPETDELFLVISGEIAIELDTGSVHLGPGQLFVVPQGVAHRPVAITDVAEVLLFEPSETVNTGDQPGELTSRRRVI
jgi:mannose-6-phosphate isomerase-like protein (cupin superfamily)